MKCPECESEKLEYLPNVDGCSWVNTKYKQVDGKWKLVATDDEDKDILTISTSDIYYNDGMSFFYCEDCTAEIDGRYV
jgi:hypothetical protein